MMSFGVYQSALLGLSLAALGPPSLLGQSQNSPITLIQSNAIERSSRLRLHTGIAWQEGRMVLNTADSLGIKGEASELRVSRQAVEGLWVRRHHTLAGFLIGTAAGAGAYFLITKGDYEDSDTAGLDNLIGAGVWAGSALVGTLVGRLIPHWTRVYP